MTSVIPLDSVPGNQATTKASDKLISFVTHNGLPVKNKETVGILFSASNSKNAICLLDEKFKLLLSPTPSAYGCSPYATIARS